MKRSKSEYVIQTVTNALRILEELGSADDLGVTELARRLSLHKNNVFRLLATLEEAGYAEQCRQSDRYRLGVRCVELGESFARSRSLARHGRAALEELARATGESSHLGVLDGYAVVHVDGQEPDRIVITTLRRGARLDAHCTALGKVLLAHAAPGVLEGFDRERIREGALPLHTPATITDREKFLEHLRMVSTQGYALDVEECEPGLCCAAAPVHDGRGAVVAALSISGPSSRLGPDDLLQRAVPAVTRAAAGLSRQLGHAA